MSHGPICTASCGEEYVTRSPRGPVLVLLLSTDDRIIGRNKSGL